MVQRRLWILALLVAVLTGGGVAVVANRSGTDGPADLAVADGPPTTEALVATSTLATTTTSTVATTPSTVVRTTSTKPPTSTTRGPVSTNTVPARPGARPTTTVTVPHASTGQGPSLPKVMLARGGPVPGHENDYLYVALMGWADDADGFVRTLLLDWGDGSPVQTLPGDSLGCRPSATGWPRPSLASISRTPPVWHQYFEKLTYFTVTLTAVSTGCDGSQEQRGTSSLSVFIPA